MYIHNQKEKDGDITIKTVVNILNIGKVFHISYLEEKKISNTYLTTMDNNQKFLCVLIVLQCKLNHANFSCKKNYEIKIYCRKVLRIIESHLYLKAFLTVQKKIFH